KLFHIMNQLGLETTDLESMNDLLKQKLAVLERLKPFILESQSMPSDVRAHFHRIIGSYIYEAGSRAIPEKGSTTPLAAMGAEIFYRKLVFRANYRGDEFLNQLTQAGADDLVSFADTWRKSKSWHSAVEPQRELALDREFLNHVLNL